MLLPAGMLVALAACRDDAPNGPLTVIPVPVSVRDAGGRLVLGEGARIVADPEVVREGELLAEVLRRSTGFAFPVVTGRARRGDVVLVVDRTAAAGEGYRLEVDRQVTVRAATAAGVFWGCQTLRQLLPAAVESARRVEGVEWAVPRVTIEDRPRFEWRGVMLDVARHFFEPAEVRRLIDVAAAYKLDRLHLHLTDDQGWRIEIPSWPDLARIGGATEVGGGEGGYYTLRDYRELVAYAAERHVTVVPEIDLPGHCNAALASYGELNPDGVRAAPYTGMNVGFSALWLDGPDTDRFVSDVWAAVAAETPGPWLHVGGDEARETPIEDYAPFLAGLQSTVEGLGKTLVGWEEIGNAPLRAPVVVQYWRDRSLARAAVAQGAQLLASPADHAYLDMIYDLDSPVGGFWAGPTPVEDAYVWDPVEPDWSESQVVGIEAPMWTETTATFEDVEFLVFPRLLGHAEIGWSPVEGRDWAGYRERLAAAGPRLDAWSVGFSAVDEVDWVR